MGIGPRAAPTGLLPVAPPRYSLLNVPGVVVPGDVRWANGLAVEAEDCDVPLELTGGETTDVPYWWQCEGTGGQSASAAYTGRMTSAGVGAKLIGAHGAPLQSDPFTVWAGYACTTMEAGVPDLVADKEARVVRRLAALTPAAVERELWTGAVAARAGFPNDALMDVGSLTNLGGPFGFAAALGELEQALAGDVLQGRTMIHAQPRVVNLWVARGLVGPNADRTALVTALGTVVVAGHGYPGTPPATLGGPPVSYAVSYAYATGWVNVWLGPVESSLSEVGGGTVERTQNTLQVRAERTALTIWDPCTHKGVWVDLCDPWCGTGS